MNWFMSLAYAANEASAPATPAAPAAPSVIAQLFPLIFLILIFYFILIRPQQQRQKKQAELLNSIQKGDKVVTIGGIHGTVAQVDDSEVLLEVDKNTKLRLSKSAIANKE
jgi:preprotein translocase subunit YajC